MGSKKLPVPGLRIGFTLSILTNGNKVQLDEVSAMTVLARADRGELNLKVLTDNTVVVINSKTLSIRL
jgi:hypothetical protein